MNGKIKNRIYSFDEEKIIDYSKLSAEEKLNWLEDALIFNNLVFSPEDKKIREKIAKGRLD